MSAGVNNIVGCRDVLLFADNMKFAGVLRSEGEVWWRRITFPTEVLAVLTDLRILEVFFFLWTNGNSNQGWSRNDFICLPSLWIIGNLCFLRVASKSLFQFREIVLVGPSQGKAPTLITCSRSSRSFKCRRIKLRLNSKNVFISFLLSVYTVSSKQTGCRYREIYVVDDTVSNVIYKYSSRKIKWFMWFINIQSKINLSFPTINLSFISSWHNQPSLRPPLPHPLWTLFFVLWN